MFETTFSNTFEWDYDEWDESTSEFEPFDPEDDFEFPGFIGAGVEEELWRLHSLDSLH